MYEIEKRFFNKDESLNIELAMAAGRQARSQHLREGIRIVGDMAVRLIQCIRCAAAQRICRAFDVRS